MPDSPDPPRPNAMNNPDHDHKLCQLSNPTRGARCECPCSMCRAINGPLPPDPPRTPAAPSQCSCGHCSKGLPRTPAAGMPPFAPDGSCCFKHPAPRTPAAGEEMAERWKQYEQVYGPIPQPPALPPDQMTALERQLTAEVEWLTKRSDQQMQAGLRIAEERDQLRAQLAEAEAGWRDESRELQKARAVVEAARVEEESHLSCSERPRVHRLICVLAKALDALDGSHAAHNEPQGT